MEKEIIEKKFSSGWSAVKGNWSAKEEIDSHSHESGSIYVSAHEPSFVCWVVAWSEPGGNSKVTFVEVVGRPSLYPTMHFNDPGLDCHNKTLITEDGGESWRDTGWKEPLDSLDGNSDHHWRAVAANNDGILIRMMPRIIPGVTDPEGRRYIYDPSAAETRFAFRCHRPYEISPKFPVYWNSRDGGKTWQEVFFMRDRPEGWWCTDMILLENGRLLTMGMVHGIQGKDAYYKNARLAVSESADSARTWTRPQVLDLPVDIFGDIGWTEENGIVELSPGRVLAVCRITGPGTRWLALLTKTANQWEVEDCWVSELPYGGHPFTMKASCGTIFYNGHDGVWSSVNEGRSWTKQSGARSYYPQLVEAAPGKIISLGHVGIGDTPWPAPQESNIQASSFMYRHIEQYEQSDASSGFCLSVLQDSPDSDFHLRVQIKLTERAGIAFRIQDDPEDGFYVCATRFPDGPGRWGTPKSFSPAPVILEIIKLKGKSAATIFKRHAGECVPGTWVEMQLRMAGNEILGALLLPGGVRPQYVAAQDGEFSRGKLGLFTHISPASFKNLAVWSQVQMIRDNWLTIAHEVERGLIPDTLT